MDTQSWAWVSGTPLPGFSTGNPNNLGAGLNGHSVDPGTCQGITWHDQNSDGIFYDNDTDDRSAAGMDHVVINGVSKTIHEVALYTNSTMVMNGQTYNVSMVVWVFTDGTYMVRIPDSQIPAGHSYTQVQGLTLGTWNGQEYAGNYSSSFDQGFVCFAAGTHIDTPAGAQRVEDLRSGDLVITEDSGDQVLVWTGRRRVPASGTMAPIRILAGTLGNRRDLWVSPQHRMLVSGWRAELWFGAAEVLVPAKALVNGRSVFQEPRPSILYVHLLFDRHQIVFAEGARSESLHPGDMALGWMDGTSRDEITALFPALRTVTGRTRTARPVVRASQACVLAV